MEKKQRGMAIYLGIISMLMVICLVPCRLLAKYGDIEWNILRVLAVIASGLVFGLVVAFLSCAYFKNRDRISSFKGSDKVTMRRPLPKHLWFIWPILTLAYLPAYLAYFPGNCCYDFLPQVGQILYGPLNDHHPLVHTLILKLFMTIGETFLGSWSAGFGLFCLLQMIIVAGVFSYCIIKVSRFTQRRSTAIVLTLLFALYPFNHYLSISITKDIPFSLAFIAMVTSLLSILFSKEEGGRLSDGTVLFISGLFVVIFRNNGRYSLLFFLVITFILFLVKKGKRKLYLRIFLNGFFSLAIGMVIVVGVKKITNAEGGDKREMFSVPIQQIARVVNYKYDELDPAIIAEAEKLILPSSLYDYRPDISDPVKRDAISWEILHRPKNTLNTYLTLLKAYPSEYVNAYLQLYAGFLDPFDQSHRYINDRGEGVPTGLHYVQTVFYDEAVEKGFWQKPVSQLLHSVYEWYANNDVYIKVPLLSAFFVPGTFLWFYLYFAGLCVYRKKKEILLPMALVLGYFITLFLGPTVQLRYIYPLMICVPVLISFMRTTNEQ